MPIGIELIFWALAGLVLVGVPAYALLMRGRTYAIFASVLLLLSLPGAIVTHARLVSWADPGGVPLIGALFSYGTLALGVHLAHLVRARLRSRTFRVFASTPGQVFLAAGFMAGVWQLALLPVRLLLGWAGLEAALHALRWLDLAPFALAAFSVITSKRAVTEWVRVALGPEGPAQVERLPVHRVRGRAPVPPAGAALRIVQITDPHLGPWQTVRRLQHRLDDLLRHDPDLVLLTGDFLTMEGQGTPGALADALAPLQRVSERCYAIFGNHDHEAPEEVREALAVNGVRLLVDQEAVAMTRGGAVQIVGADYRGRDRREHIQQLLARFPRRQDMPRLLLLHDPLGFHHVPKGEVDLTLSGHTHGGQVGLVSFGLDWTVLSRSAWPDHGLFGHGSNRLYVHRGTGFYGFPLRMGVPGEFSVLDLFVAGTFIP